MVQCTMWLPYWRKVDALKLGRLEKLRVDEWITTTQAVDISEVSQHVHSALDDGLESRVRKAAGEIQVSF